MPIERRWAALLWVVAPSVIAWIVADTVPTHQYLCFAEKQRYYSLPSHSETELHATLIVASQCSSVELRVSFAAHRSGALRRASHPPVPVVIDLLRLGRVAFGGPSADTFGGPVLGVSGHLLCRCE